MRPRGNLAPIGDALKADGIATWTIEYRRLGQPGGGWAGTHLDVGRAVDRLRALAARHNLDLGRVVLLGHSAGGHLAMRAAARTRALRRRYQTATHTPHRSSCCPSEFRRC
jgi:acetyl esterase/lipase